MGVKRFVNWLRRHRIAAAEYKAEVERLKGELTAVQLVADQRAESYLQMRSRRDEALTDLAPTVEERDQLHQELTETSARLDAVIVEINKLAVDLHALSIGAKPPSGRHLTWAGDIEAALRKAVDEAELPETGDEEVA